MPPEIRTDQLDRLIDAAVEEAEGAVLFVPDGYVSGTRSGITLSRGKRRAAERDDEED